MSDLNRNFSNKNITGVSLLDDAYQNEKFSKIKEFFYWRYDSFHRRCRDRKSEPNLSATTVRKDMGYCPICDRVWQWKPKVTSHKCSQYLIRHEYLYHFPKLGQNEKVCSTCNNRKEKINSV